MITVWTLNRFTGSNKQVIVSGSAIGFGRSLFFCLDLNLLKLLTFSQTNEETVEKMVATFENLLQSKLDDRELI